MLLIFITCESHFASHCLK